MINQQTLAGDWNQVRGKLKEKWGSLTNDDVATFNGNVDQLVGRIQRKTGESRESIERFLDEVTSEGSQVLAGIRDKVQEGASQVADSARQGFEAVREGYAETERVVQEHPAQSMAVAFGLGLLSGLGLALLLRDRPRQSALSRGRAATEQFARQMMDALSDMVPDSLSKFAGK